MKLDAEFITLVRRPICTVWDYIGSDLEQICAESNERMRNADVIEACIDADRIVTICTRSPEAKVRAQVAYTALREAIDANGYPKVLRYLAKHIKLA